MEITRLQMMWLTTRGGRTIDDIVLNENKEASIIMRAYQEDIYVPIPNDQGIKRMYNLYYDARLYVVSKRK